LLTGHCLVTAGCCDNTILYLSEYATLSYLFTREEYLPMNEKATKKRGGK
jgi:hypothetical protein